MARKNGEPTKALLQSYRVAAGLPTSPPPQLDTLHGEPVHLKLHRLLPSSQKGGGGRTQSVSRHMVQSGQFDAARRLRNARRQFILPVTVCRSRLLVLQSIPSQQWRLSIAGDRQRLPLPVLVTDTPIDPSLLCIPINWTEAEAAAAACGTRSSPTPSPGIPPVAVPPPSAALFRRLSPPHPRYFLGPRLAPDKGQLFHGDNSHSSLTTASGDRVSVMKNRSISCAHTSRVIEACHRSDASTPGEL